MKTTETIWLCDVCGEPVDEETFHWFHEPECPRAIDPEAEYTCDCDLVAHPECCPYCKQQEDAP
jgi:hypothetical protein